MKPEQGSTGRTDITLELIHNALETLADEMSFTVSRTGRSVITKDLYDFSCAIFDPQGQLLVQGAGLPAAIGAMPDAAEAMLRWVGDDLDPGDVVILNDPYDGGTHLPDIFVFRPIFYQDLLVGFSGVYSHHVDIGGRVPGSSAHDSTEIYQEGLRLPPLKLYRRGVADDTVFRIVERNVRAPEMVLRRFASPSGGLLRRGAGILEAGGAVR